MCTVARRAAYRCYVTGLDVSAIDSTYSTVTIESSSDLAVQHAERFHEASQAPVEKHVA